MALLLLRSNHGSLKDGLLSKELRWTGRILRRGEWVKGHPPSDIELGSGNIYRDNTEEEEEVQRACHLKMIAPLFLGELSPQESPTLMFMKEWAIAQWNLW